MKKVDQAVIDSAVDFYFTELCRFKLSLSEEAQLFLKNEARQLVSKCSGYSSSRTSKFVKAFNLRRCMYSPDAYGFLWLWYQIFSDSFPYWRLVHEKEKAYVESTESTFVS